MIHNQTLRVQFKLVWLGPALFYRKQKIKDLQAFASRLSLHDSYTTITSLRLSVLMSPAHLWPRLNKNKYLQAFCFKAKLNT